jgi:hypothetical protein
MPAPPIPMLDNELDSPGSARTLCGIRGDTPVENTRAGGDVDNLRAFHTCVENLV